MNNCDILIVEDEALIAMDIEMTLESAGFENIAVCHGILAAMAQIETGSPKVALLDFNLGKDGNSIPVAHRLMKDDVPVIFLSGYTEKTVKIPDDLSHAGRLAKPFQSDDLIAKVKNAINGA